MSTKLEQMSLEQFAKYITKQKETRKKYNKKRWSIMKEKEQLAKERGLLK